MKTAIVHDWLVTYGGAERALQQLILLFPDADLFSIVDFIPEGERSFLLNKKSTTSFIQSLPFAREKYRSYLPLMPFAVEQFDLSGYDLVISSSHAVAKGVLTHVSQQHICYCYTPMRYAWDLHYQYLNETGLNRGLKGSFARLILHYIRLWDSASACRVDHYIAISNFIAQRIKKLYNRDASVIYPPVDVDFFIPGTRKDDFYLTVSRLVPYKKVSLLVDAFSCLPDRKLIVIGDGPELQKIKSKSGKNIELLGCQPPAVVRDYMREAKAFVFAAEEDFGIVTVEAQACGTPVIAFAKGGSLETIANGETGMFFAEQSVEGIIAAVKAFEKTEDAYQTSRLRKNAEQFSIERFKREWQSFLDQALEARS